MQVRKVSHDREYLGKSSDNEHNNTKREERGEEGCREHAGKVNELGGK